MTAAPNSAQAEAWNGKEGAAWARRRPVIEEAYDVELTRRLLVAARAGGRDRVLDIGCGTGGTHPARRRAGAVRGARRRAAARPLPAGERGEPRGTGCRRWGASGAA